MQEARTVLKALDLLGLLSAHPEGLRIAEIALALNQPRSNVVRLLETLRGYGFVRAARKKWRLTNAFHEWAAPGDRHQQLRRKYRPVLDTVAAETGELVLLGIHEGGGIVILDYVESDHVVRVAPPETRHNLRRTAFGKLALSRRPDLWDKIGDGDWPAECGRIRESGVAWNREETVPGMIALAAPGFSNLPAEPMLAVAWPVFRFSESKGRAALRAIGNARASYPETEPQG